MTVLFRLLLRRLLIAVVAGFVIRRLLGSSHPRARRAGELADRYAGRFLGVDSRRKSRGVGTAPATRN